MRTDDRWGLITFQLFCGVLGILQQLASNTQVLLIVPEWGVVM